MGALITTITGLIGGKSLEFKTFKEISGQFRRNQLTPDAYFGQCKALVSKDNFDAFFPELLVLLPDIRMQGELLSLYLQHGGKAASSLQQCETCAQVCLAGGESECHASNLSFSFFLLLSLSFSFFLFLSLSFSFFLFLSLSSSFFLFPFLSLSFSLSW